MNPEETSPANDMEDHDGSEFIRKTNSAIFSDPKSQPVLLDQERYLPIANVVRIMKTQMDPQAKLAKDAKESVQECVSEFISFIASEAAELCHNTKRKTITADDLLTALEATGFDNYAEPMRLFLMKYRQAHKVTGPIHRPHANYTRPKQYAEDGPIKRLFFDTENGRRCTETQYVINGSEVVKNAPLGDEWNEQTGTLKVPLDFVGNNQDDAEQIIKETESPESAQTTIENSETVIALEQQQQMQIYIDPTSKQHYAAMETANGMELYPIMIQDTPVQLENLGNEEHVLVHLDDGVTAESHDMPISDSVPKSAQNMDKKFRRKHTKRGKTQDSISTDSSLDSNINGTNSKKKNRRF